MTHAIIMAGGRGERLRPMTDTQPKPALTVAGRSAIGYAIKMVEAAGIGSATATVHYMPDSISDAVRAIETPVDVDFYVEVEQLGTSGSAAAAVRERCGADMDEIVILSGDGVCDYDLRPILAYHRRVGADATIVMAESDTPELYGNVELAPDGGGKCGRVVGFVEKPKGKRPPALVNTGIYVLSRRVMDAIPYGESDFARDIFPAMMARGGVINAIAGSGYWCDIGSPEALRRANFDAAKNMIRGVGAKISPTGAIAASSSHVGMGSRTPGSVLYPDVTVGVDSVVTDSILCRGVTVGDRAIVGKNCVFGECAVIASGAVVPDGSRIPAGTVIGATRFEMA